MDVRNLGGGGGEITPFLKSAKVVGKG